VKLKLLFILLGLSIISISVPAAFSDTIVSTLDIRCHERTDDCDVTNPSSDLQTEILDPLGFTVLPQPGDETISTVFSAPIFLPPPVTDPPTPPIVFSELTFRALRDTGAFSYEFGYCPQEAVAGIDPIGDKENYAASCLSHPRAMTLFADGATFEDVFVGSTTTVTVCAVGCDVTPGEVMRFWLIPNNNRATFVANCAPFENPSCDFYPSVVTPNSLRAPLFQDDDANPGEFDQLLTFIKMDFDPEVDPAGTIFSWEDLTRTVLAPASGGSDQDFTDLAFSVDTQLEDICMIQTPPLVGIACTCFIDPDNPLCNDIGGEFLAIDSSALLLAGLQSSAIWILPIVLAGAGTGLGIAAFHLRKK